MRAASASGLPLRRGTLLGVLAAWCAPRLAPSIAEGLSSADASRVATAAAQLSNADSSRAAELYASGARLNGGRGANALLKVRATTGVERTGTIASPLFKPGQILDELKGATPGAGPVSIAFSFPAAWSVASGPNLDVRDVRTSDSAFLIVARMPEGMSSLRDLPDTFFTDALFDPAGKYGAYGGLADGPRFLSSVALELSDSRGGRQPYRRLSIKFSPLTYNQNAVERRALISATEVGGAVYILVAGCLATRYKKAADELRDVQESFRAIGLKSAPRTGN